jgi:hypothetical protein
VAATIGEGSGGGSGGGEERQWTGAQRTMYGIITSSTRGSIGVVAWPSR